MSDKFKTYRRMILFFRRRPDRAAEMLLNQTLLPIQRILLFTAWFVPFVFIIISRGGGKTFILALLTMLRALLYSKQRIGIIAASYRQSKLVFNEIKRIYQQSKLLQDCCVKPPVMGTDNCNLHFKNGSEIIAIPLGDGGKIRGSRFYFLVIDERAQIPIDIIDKVIVGMTATVQDPVFNVKRQEIIDKYGIDIAKFKKEAMQNHIISASTAFYQFNHLWETINKVAVMIQDKKVIDGKDFYKMYAIIKAAYNLYPPGFMNDATIAHAKETMSDMEFGMEYRGFFPPESGGFFPPQIVLGAVSLENDAKVLIKGRKDKQYVLFVDPARKVANCAFVVIEIGAISNLICCVETLNNAQFQDMALKVWDFVNRFNIVRIAMDAGGGGREIKDLLCDDRICPAEFDLIFDPADSISFEDEEMKRPKQGRHILHMIDFTPKFLYEANHALLSGFERRAVLFPRPLGSEDFKGLTEQEAAILEQVEFEIQETKREILCIIIKSTPKGYPTWVPANQKQRVDRYDGVMGGYFEIKAMFKEPVREEVELPTGQWMGDLRVTPVGVKYETSDIALDDDRRNSISQGFEREGSLVKESDKNTTKRTIYSDVEL